MMNIYCQRGEFLTLFFNTKIKVTEYNSHSLNYLHTNNTMTGILEFDDGIIKDFCVTFIEPIRDSIESTTKQFLDSDNKRCVEFEDITNPVFNPKPNSLIIFDRSEVEASFKYLEESVGVSILHKLYDRWAKRNVRVLFNFAYWEALCYETLEYHFMTQEFPFKNIKLTDYELFENKEGFIFDKLYNLFYYIKQHLELGNILDRKNCHVGSSFKPVDVLKNEHFIINHTFPKEKLFTSLQCKPRSHRAYFIDKILETGLINDAFLSLSKVSYYEEIEKFKTGHGSSDNNTRINEYYYRYRDDQIQFYKKPWEYYESIISKDSSDQRFLNHVMHYYNKLEYDKSVIDINGETHILFDTMYPIFTEKSYNPIFFEKIHLTYGGNEFYRVFNDIGGYNFLEELMLPDDYITIDDPYKQVDLIIESLTKFNKTSFEDLYKESVDKIKNNKNILIDHYSSIISKVYDFVLDE